MAFLTIGLVTVTVDTGGAGIGAVAVPVEALSDAIPSGTVLTFTGGKLATLTAAAAAGAVSLTVAALAAALVAGDVANYPGVDYWVLADDATENESDDGIDSVRAIDGTLRLGDGYSKEQFRFGLEPMTQAAYLAFRAGRHNRIAAVAGDACPAGDYAIRVLDAPYIWKSDTEFTRAPTIALRRA